MVVDTSAVLAILLQEADASVFAEAIETAELRLISAVSVLEAGILLRSRKGDVGEQELDTFLAASGLQVVPFDEEQALVARSGFSRFGRGRPPAGLNFGDCAVYALAATRGEPVLFKGGDFSATDLEAHLPDTGA